MRKKEREKKREGRRKGNREERGWKGGGGKGGGRESNRKSRSRADMYSWYEPAVEFYCRLLTVYKPQFCPVALQSPGPSFSVSLGSLIHLLGSGKMPHPSPWTANQAGDDSLPGSDVTGPPHVRTGGIYTVT